MRKTESQKIALCGVLGALSVVLLLVGAALLALSLGVTIRYGRFYNPFM